MDWGHLTSRRVQNSPCERPTAKGTGCHKGCRHLRQQVCWLQQNTTIMWQWAKRQGNTNKQTQQFFSHLSCSLKTIKAWFADTPTAAAQVTASSFFSQRNSGFKHARFKDASTRHLVWNTWHKRTATENQYEDIFNTKINMKTFLTQCSLHSWK